MTIGREVLAGLLTAICVGATALGQTPATEIKEDTTKPAPKAEAVKTESSQSLARTERTAKKVTLSEEAGKHDWLVKHPTITRLLELHNETRARYGRAPLRLNTDMSLQAQAHADRMSSYGWFSHSGLPYRENIYQGIQTPEAAIQGWTYSPGHFQNLLSGSEVGFGYSMINGRASWVAVFR
jgi:uncharacterized protein YkwD